MVGPRSRLTVDSVCVVLGVVLLCCGGVLGFDGYDDIFGSVAVGAEPMRSDSSGGEEVRGGGITNINHQIALALNAKPVAKTGGGEKEDVGDGGKEDVRDDESHGSKGDASSPEPSGLPDILGQLAVPHIETSTKLVVEDDDVAESSSENTTDSHEESHGGCDGGSCPVSFGNKSEKPEKPVKHESGCDGGFCAVPMPTTRDNSEKRDSLHKSGDHDSRVDVPEGSSVSEPEGSEDDLMGSHRDTGDFLKVPQDPHVAQPATYRPRPSDTDGLAPTDPTSVPAPGSADAETSIDEPHGTPHENDDDTSFTSLSSEPSSPLPPRVESMSPVEKTGSPPADSGLPVEESRSPVEELGPPIQDSEPPKGLSKDCDRKAYANLIKERERAEVVEKSQGNGLKERITETSTQTVTSADGNIQTVTKSQSYLRKAGNAAEAARDRFSTLDARVKRVEEKCRDYWNSQPE